MGTRWDFKTPVHWVHWVPVQEKPHGILAARLAQSSPPAHNHPRAGSQVSETQRESDQRSVREIHVQIC